MPSPPLEDTWHHRLRGEVSLEEGFVARNTLDTDDIVRTDLDDLIDHQEGIAVWEKLTNTVDIENRCRIRT